MSEEIYQPRLRRNPAERQFQQWEMSQGSRLFSRGWPDFLVVTNQGELRIVKVQKDRNRNLPAKQLRILNQLARAGLPCYRWTPKGGYERVLPPGLRD